MTGCLHNITRFYALQNHNDWISFSHCLVKRLLPRLRLVPSMAEPGTSLYRYMCSGPTLAAAGEPIQPNRPGQADPPTVLAPGVAHIEGGLTFLVNNDLQLDVSAGASLNDAAPDFFVAAGVPGAFPASNINGFAHR